MSEALRGKLPLLPTVVGATPRSRQADATCKWFRTTKQQLQIVWKARGVLTARVSERLVARDFAGPMFPSVSSRDSDIADRWSCNSGDAQFHAEDPLRDGATQDAILKHRIKSNEAFEYTALNSFVILTHRSVSLRMNC